MKLPQLITYTNTMIYCIANLTFLNKQISHYIGKYANHVKYENAKNTVEVITYSFTYIDPINNLIYVLINVPNPILEVWLMD